MSVEQSSATVSAKTVTAPDGRGGVGKGKAAASQGAGDALPGGFLALLTALDEPEAVASLPGEPTLGLPEVLVAPAVVPDKCLMTEVPWSEVAMLLGQKMPPNATTPSGEVSASGGLPTVVLTPVNENFSFSVLPEGGDASPVHQLNAGLVVGGQPDAVVQPLVPMEVLIPDVGADVATARLTKDGALPDVAPQGLAVHSRKVGGTDPQLLAATSAAESRALKPLALMDLVVNEPSWSGALVSSGLGTDLLNPASRTPARSLAGPAGAGLEGSFAQHALSQGSPASASTATTGPALSPEFALAEQVTYWVSQGVQNAQLKLEGFGAEPVEVSIVVKGQEAQIDFRTDQPELRQMLEGALSHLKETLAREGLVLSGVSVGASGQEGAGAQDRRHQPSTRKATVTAHEAASTVSLQRASPSTGRALDVFV